MRKVSGKTRKNDQNLSKVELFVHSGMWGWLWPCIGLCFNIRISVNLIKGRETKTENVTYNKRKYLPHSFQVWCGLVVTIALETQKAYVMQSSKMSLKLKVLSFVFWHFLLGYYLSFNLVKIPWRLGDRFLRNSI